MRAAAAILVFTGLLSVSSIAWAKKAKDPCRVVDTEESKFDGRIREVTEEIASSTKLSIIEKDGEYLVYVRLVESGMQMNSVSPGDKLDIALESQAIELQTTTEVTPAGKVSEYGVYSTWEIYYPISREQLESIANSTIEGIRVWVGTTSYERAVSKSDAEKYSNGATCFTSTEPI